MAEVIKLIKSSTVQSFCNGCERKLSDGSCEADMRDGQDQIRYAQRGSCRWAYKKGITGTMTRKGFIPGRKP